MTTKEYKNLMIDILKMKKDDFYKRCKDNDYTSGIMAGLDEAIYTLENSNFLIEE